MVFADTSIKRVSWDAHRQDRRQVEGGGYATDQCRGLVEENTEQR
jgi:hypothetical protein